MGLINNIINFVFPIQRRLYHPTGRFFSKSTQFRSPIMQRRFAQGRLWRTTARPILQRAQNRAVYQIPRLNPIRPFSQVQTQTPKPMQVQQAQKKSFWGEMFSPNINPPSMRAQQKRKGFGSTALNLIRWNNMFRR